MLTTATQQRNSQANLQGNPQSETPPISIETSPIAPIIDAAIIFSLRFTARMKRIGALLIMSILMVFLAACGGGGGGGNGGNGGDDDKETEDPISESNLRVIPFAVTGLYGIAGADYVTLSWNNPDASIDGISISYEESGSGNSEDAPLITDSPKRAANASVQHNISGLMTGGESYDFTVSLILSGPDAGREGAPPSIRNILVNADYDGDGKNNFADVDADGDGLIEIATAQQLNQIRHNLRGSSFKASAGDSGDANGCGNGGDITECNGYELIADIYLTTYANWEPIGRCTTSASDCTPVNALFNATFDGNNHTINDLTITNPAGSYDNAAGLFGAISSDSILRNIHIRSANLIGGGTNVGLLVGYARGAMIINSSVEGAVDASGDDVGGLVGDGRFATITSSYAAGGDVSGTGDDVGGLVGGGDDAIITSSYAAGGAVSGGDSVGGLVGDGDSAEITSSYAAGGDVSGGDFVGGLVGFMNSAEITSSYAAGGDVSGTANEVGGLVGYGFGSTITSSYAAGGAVSGGDSVGGLVGWGNSATITSSYAAGGDVSGTLDSVGGLVGNGLSSTITSSYAAGVAVSGTGDSVGGLVGYGREATITSSYAAGGAVSGTGSDVGGLVGDGGGSTITFSYWDSEKSEQSSSDGGEGKTTQELKAGADGIYSTWSSGPSGTCADGTTRTWDFGTAFDYPALNCTPGGLPAQEHLRRQR